MKRGMRIWSITLIFVLFLSSVVIAGEVSSDLKEKLSSVGNNQRVEVIVVFEREVGPSEISMIKSHGANIKAQYKIVDAVAVSIPKMAAELIANISFVKSVEPDYEVKVVLDSSALQIEADNVWDSGTEGEGVDVAIIDTGINSDHEALSVKNSVDFTGEGIGDLNGHGTHVAGIVASNDVKYKGIAFEANLLEVKVLNKEGVGTASDVISGIEWAVDNGAEVLSLSLGAVVNRCDGSDVVSKAVDAAFEEGSVVVVAAGNFGPDGETITSPGCAKNALTVGAVDDNDFVASFSSRGPTADGRVKPDVVAPGVKITSTWESNHFGSLSGTSMATPHVSGLAALILETDNSLSPTDVKEIIMSNSVDLGLEENVQGKGRINAYDSYIALGNITEELNETEENITEIDGGKRNITHHLPPGLKDKAGIVPGNVFYNFERRLERFRLKFVNDELKKAELEIEYAEERFAEALHLLDEGEDEKADEILQEYEEGLERGEEISEIAKGLGKNTTRVDELVAKATSIHLEVLDDVYKKVPEQAQGSIERVINSSIKERSESSADLKEKGVPVPEEAFDSGDKGDIGKGGVASESVGASGGKDSGNSGVGKSGASISSSASGGKSQGKGIN